MPTTRTRAVSGAAPLELQLLTRRDVCEFLGISGVTLTEHVKSGKIPAPKRIGRKQYWLPGELIRFIEAQP